MKAQYAIDGSFCMTEIYGIQRYAREVTAVLDRDPAAAERLTLVVPAYFEGELDLRNIPVVRYGSHRGKLWRQIDLAAYLCAHRVQGIFFENIAPFAARRGIIVLHDVIFRARPDFFRGGLRGIRSILWQWLIYRSIAWSRMRIVTVSEFTKQEILRYYPMPSGRIDVLGNGWEHMERVAEEPLYRATTMDRRALPESAEHAAVERAEAVGLAEAVERAEAIGSPFLFALASASTRHKNLPWLLRAASANPDLTFLVAGGFDASRIGGGKIPANLHFLGYISDGQIKYLMRRCSAFLFPSYYEGFGIPPLEAAACGAPRLVLADIPVLREIYGEYAHFIDPDGSGEELAQALKTPASDFNGLLAAHTWAETAGGFRTILGMGEE